MPARPLPPLSGTRRFHSGDTPLDFDVVSFWRWVASDLLGNALRGKLAEYLVARALDAANGVRLEWDSVDVKTADGLLVEVKSAAYVQSWDQKKPSAISFDITPKSGWDAATNEYSTKAERSAHVYVFALLGEPEQTEVDPLDVAQWRFFVLPTLTLNERCAGQKRISLSSLRKLAPVEAAWSDLAQAIRNAASRE